MTCVISFQLQNFRHVLSEFLLFKFRHCEDYSGQSKPFFEPLNFAELRCLLNLEYFDFLHLHFHWVFFTLFAYIFSVIKSMRLLSCSPNFPASKSKQSINSLFFIWSWMYNLGGSSNSTEIHSGSCGTAFNPSSHQVEFYSSPQFSLVSS